MSMALTELEPLLEPQERLDRLITTAFRRFGPKVVDLSHANAYGGPDRQVRHALEDAVWEEGRLAFQYSPYGGRTITRRLIAEQLSEEYGLPFDYRHIVMTAGAMAALNLVFRACFGPDDEIIVPVPCWHDYPLYLRNLNIPFRLVPLRADKHLDQEAIGAVLGERTRGVLLSQPCCPTGVSYSKAELDALGRQLADAERRFGTRINLVSDEVHRRVDWGGRPCHSPLLSYPRSFSIYSFGKRLLLQGQRIGYVAVSPRMPGDEAMAHALERWARVTGFCTPTDLMQRALCKLIDHHPCWDRLAESQHAVRSALTAYGYEICPADATFFVYARAPIAEDFRFAEMAASCGVLVVPSTLFHERGWFRLSLAGRPRPLGAALEVFSRLIEEHSPRVRHA
jgi:aspartate aminotransferase